MFQLTRREIHLHKTNFLKPTHLDLRSRLESAREQAAIALSRGNGPAYVSAQEQIQHYLALVK